MDTSEAAVTFKRVPPVTVPMLAETEVVPLAAADARPAEFTAATVDDEDVQVTEFVRSCVLPSENVPMACNCCLVPGAINGLPGSTAIETNPIPVPLKLRICGLLLPLSVAVTVPVRGPAAAGVNVTVITQLEPLVNELGQLFCCVKSPAAFSEIPVMVLVPLLSNEAV